MIKLFILNGPNLNMLGWREKDQYGNFTLAEVEAYTNSELEGRFDLSWWQSNSETEMIERIHTLLDEDFDGLIINPAAFSHTSVAILDALLMLKIPIVEVHLSNVYKREAFRQTMLTAKAASTIMSGLGKNAYIMGAEALARLLKGTK